jgi:DNA-3-methyladenine glycosylase II
MARTLTSIRSIQKHLAEQDKKLAKHLKNAPLYPVAGNPENNSHYETIVFSIVGQQLSGKAASTIRKRLTDQTKIPVKPKKVLALGHDKLREVGLSNAKTRTILEFSQAIVDGFDIEHVHELPDEEVLKQLTQFWGIGKWTVEMFMMFRLGRMDVWPGGDLGVRKGWQIIQGLKEMPTEKEMTHLADHLAPYRSVVAWHCWRAVDGD